MSRPSPAAVAVFALYDAAWRAVGPPLRLLAALDGRARARGWGLLPGRWRLADRLPSAQIRGREDARPVVWIHAASLGESKGMWALAESLMDSRMDSRKDGGFPGRLLLTSGTASGLDFLAERLAAREGRLGRLGAVDVSMAPLDHPALVARFLADRSVACLCLYEVELWPNYIRAASRRRVPVLLVSARLSERAYARIGMFPAPWRALLSRMEWIQAQDRLDAERLRALMGAGVPVGTGFDYKAAYYLRERPRAEAAGAPPREDRIAFVSLHLGELRRLLPFLPALMERHALHVFPRLPQEWPAFRAALLPLGFVLHGREAAARHVLVDVLGLVARELPRCHSAFIGGSLVERGCHNLWEPLLAGAKAYFGPSVFNQEAMARDLLERGLAERVEDPADVLRWRRPAPGFAAEAREYAAKRFQDLEAAEAAFRARLEAVVSRFILFSGP